MFRYSAQNDGYKYLFTFIESFSKFAFVSKSKLKNSVCLNADINELILREGSWKIFDSDNGEEFFIKNVSAIAIFFVWKQFIEGLITHSRKDKLKDLAKLLKGRIRKGLENRSTRYVDLLDRIVYQYNNSVHSATKMKLFI